MTELAIVDNAPAALEIAPTGHMAMVNSMLERVAAIDHVIDKVMKRGVHYDKAYPGADKDSLLQPGAEIVLMSFQARPQRTVTEHDLGDGHKRFVVEGSIVDERGNVMGMGEASAEASTYESKWRYRNAQKACPECGAEEIRNSKQDPGFYCWAKMGGCGAKFPADDARITDQVTGKVEIADPADLWQTVRRMAEKRWLVAVAKTAFSLSGRFVDAETYGASRFEASGPSFSAAARRLPGDRVAQVRKMNDLALENFGKIVAELTELEGSLLTGILHKNAGPQITGESLMEPEVIPDPEAEPAELTVSDRVANACDRAEALGILNEIEADFGHPDDGWADKIDKVEAMITDHGLRQARETSEDAP